MIQKIKGLMSMQQDICSISEQMKEHEKVFCEALKEARAYNDEMNKLISENKAISIDMHKELSAVQDIKEKFSQELYDFKLMQKDLRKRFESELEKEMGSVKQMMLKEVTDFNGLKKKLDDRGAKLDKLNDEIARLSDIASKIKAEDFDLVRHRKMLEKESSEKKALEAKVDSLQRLVSGMRRKDSSGPHMRRNHL